MSAQKRVSVRHELLDGLFALMKRGTFDVPFGRVLDAIMAVQSDAQPIVEPNDQPEPVIQRMPAPEPDEEIVVTDLAGADASVKE